MTHSMTGFGKAVVELHDRKITAEIKSLNSKQVDLTLRMPPAYRSIELELRSLVATRLQRGKIELVVSCELLAGDAVPIQALNLPVLLAYKHQIRAMASALDIPEPQDWYATLLRLPDTLTTSSDVPDAAEDELNAVRDAVNDAITAMIEFRAQEGLRLQAFFEEKIDAIQSLLTNEVPLYEQSRTDKIKARLQEALSRLEGVTYDNNRLEQELIYHIERLDITEEKTRLQNHLNYFLQTLHSPEPGQGKKLGFICQEMGREINTTGSKACQAELQRVVVRMKDHLEQIKEQVLNVL